MNREHDAHGDLVNDPVAHANVHAYSTTGDPNRPWLEHGDPDEPRNEPAERLRVLLKNPIGPLMPSQLQIAFDAALAEERRHVIAQIRERLTGTRWMPGDVAAILDELSND